MSVAGVPRGKCGSGWCPTVIRQLRSLLSSTPVTSTSSMSHQVVGTELSLSFSKHALCLKDPSEEPDELV